MTPEIAAVLAITVAAVILFLSERVRVDLVALMVLVALALTGLVTPAEALSGFSNPAVITVWAMFILSGALYKTGVANKIGHQVLRLAGTSEARLVAVIMLTAAIMSAFMNNVGVAALLLPVVMDIARRTHRAPSRLLMPLAIGALLGGVLTLIGTPPNILISGILTEYGLRSFGMFSFTPVGSAMLLAGVLFMVLIGLRLLPQRDVAREELARIDLAATYGLDTQLFVVRMAKGSTLAGRPLSETRLGAGLGLNVIGIIRNGRTVLAPGSATILQDGDRLLVDGRPERLTELHASRYLEVEGRTVPVENLVSADVSLAELALSPRSGLIGQSLQQIGFRSRFGVNVLAIWRDNTPRRTHLQHIPLQHGDVLLVQGMQEQFEALQQDANFLISRAQQQHVYQLHERLVVLSVPAGSALVGKALSESRLADAFGLSVVGIMREAETRLMPAPTEVLQAGDRLLVAGRSEDLATLQGLQGLEVDTEETIDPLKLETEQTALAEVVLSPHTTLVGKTLRDIGFREKYGLTVLTIWRQGKRIDENLRDQPLQFGDALLVYGPRERLRLLGSEPDFIVLTEAAQEVLRVKKAPIAALIMAGVLFSVIVGWLPIAVAAILGVILMILSASLTMEEAYRYIDWKAVFLIAGMLPLGIAMQTSGAAELLAQGMISAIGDYGPLALVAGLYVLTTLATQVMPNAAVAVLMAPIAMNTASSMSLSPYALMMTVALAASASFLSPVAHPANVLIMGPGGYRFKDYLKVGVPLTLVILIVVLLVLPLVWPLQP